MVSRARDHSMRYLKQQVYKKKLPVYTLGTTVRYDFKTKAGPYGWKCGGSATLPVRKKTYFNRSQKYISNGNFLLWRPWRAKFTTESVIQPVRNGIFSKLFVSVKTMDIRFQSGYPVLSVARYPAESLYRDIRCWTLVGYSRYHYCFVYLTLVCSWCCNSSSASWSNSIT